MLHYQAVCGGYRFRGMADTPSESDYRFEKNGWRYYGDFGQVQAYGRPNQVVCLQPFSLPYMDMVKVTVVAGAKTRRDLQAVGDELGVTFT